MAFFQLNDVFGYQHANAIKRLWADDTAPADPGDGEVWLDTSVTPNRLKRYNGAGWDTVGDMTAGDMLTLLKTVDGSDSGLDADKLDGQEGSYYRNADNLNAGTVPLVRIPTTLTGKDADQLDGQEGSYYQNASNLNAGTVPLARIPTTLTGKSADQVDGLEGSQFVRNDAATDVNAHTEWQDTYQARFGTGGDLRVQHNGTDSFIDNYNGYLAIRQLNHGNNIYMQAEDDSGTMQNLLTLDPDTPKIESSGSFISKKYEEVISVNGVLVTDIWSKASGILIIGAAGTLNLAGLWMLTRDGVSDINEISAATLFTNTKDTAGRLNVYYENGKVNIQNKASVAHTVWVGFFGVR